MPTLRDSIGRYLVNDDISKRTDLHNEILSRLPYKGEARYDFRLIMQDYLTDHMGTGLSIPVFEQRLSRIRIVFDNYYDSTGNERSLIWVRKRLNEDG